MSNTPATGMQRHSSPLDEVWVSLDLETTGLSADDDEIIEVGAVKFQGDQTLDSYQTFVNPNRRLSNFTKQYTGITQSEVGRAPSFSAVAGDLASFIGSAPIVGHNIRFDTGFLDRRGLRLSNPRCDTWDLAFVLFPGLQEYSLPKLAEWLSVSHDRPHRALEDALATKEVFVKLVDRLSELDVYALAEMRRLAVRSSWVLSYILDRLEGDKLGPGRRPTAQAEKEGKDSKDISGLDIGELSKRIHRGRALRANRDRVDLDVDFVASLLEQGGALSNVIPGFEERSEQVAMARKVAESINRGERLIVEAGTGVGKSMAYLLPAILYAAMNNKRVVVSTNTINLQEQLLTKDVPALLDALAQVDGISVEDVNFTQLKGRANYLCLRRWYHLRSNDTFSENESRMIAKTLVWLGATATGDRSELNLGHRTAAAPWDQLSAQGALDCSGMNGLCFLRSARDKAAASHLVIVNHALLLSDVVAGGSLIPTHDILIIDEAHHLEEEATRRLGFEIWQSRIDEHLQLVGGDRGLFNGAVSAFRGSSAAATRREAVEKVATEGVGILPRVRDDVARLFAMLRQILTDVGEQDSSRGQEWRITSSTRAQPGWSELEIQWETVDALVSTVGVTLRRMMLSLEGLEEAGLIDYDGLINELTGAHQRNEELRLRIAEFFTEPKSDGIYWATRSSQSGDLTLYAAPLHVGASLDEQLYSKNDCVVLSSATLSTNGSFDHICDRTGFTGANELLLGSPFDYPSAALLCVPEDMPEPSSWAYQPALEQAISDAALATRGRAMALFTSHASLQATAAAIRGNLRAQGISVLAQGIDGTPAQLVRRFLDEPESVLLGTASFWEGVDLPGQSLKVLLVPRLPFSVPSEPVFAARSELYDNPFKEYAVPQGILRLRQGFGRLIRTTTDKGVAVILDRRITSRSYGKAFLKSLPPVAFERCSLHDLRDVVQNWLGE